MSARPATRPPAKPPPGALCPVNIRYTEKMIIGWNNTRVTTSNTSERRAGGRFGPPRNHDGVRDEVSPAIGMGSSLWWRGTLPAVRNTRLAIPVPAATKTESSPSVSQARMSTRVTLTMFLPPPYLSAASAEPSEADGQFCTMTDIHAHRVTEYHTIT